MPPAGIEQFLLPAVAHAHAEIGAIAYAGLDLRSQMMDIDDDVAHAGAVQPADLVDDERLAGDGQHRFRHPLGERLQPLAAAGCEDHRFQRLAAKVRFARGTTSAASHAASGLVSA